MNIQSFLKSILILLFITSLLFSQNPDQLNRELEKLRLAIDRIEKFIMGIEDSQIRELLTSRLLKVKEEYQAAILAISQRRFAQATIHLRSAFHLLQAMERQLQNQPFFRLKFKENLDNKIEQAENIIGFSSNPEAVRMLNRAKYFRQRALMMGREGQAFSAVEFYRLAIFFANQAINLTKRDAKSIAENWDNLLRDTQALIEEARLRADRMNNSQMMARIHDFEKELNVARRLFENQNPVAATNRLNFIQRNLYRLFSSDNLAVNESERLEIDLSSLEMALREIEMELQDNQNSAAQKIYERVRLLTNEIQNHIRGKEHIQARQKLLLANRLILKLYRLLENALFNQPTEIASQLSITRQNLNDLMNNNEDFSFRRELIELAGTQLRLAEENYQSGNFNRASVHLNFANRLILRFNRIRFLKTDRNLNENTVENDLVRLEELVNRLSGETDYNEDLSIVMFETVQKLSHMARQAYNQGNLELCQELTMTTLNLISK